MNPPGKAPEGELALGLAGQKHVQQNKKAGCLGERRGNSRAAGAQVKDKDKDGIPEIPLEQVIEAKRFVEENEK